MLGLSFWFELVLRGGSVPPRGRGHLQGTQEAHTRNLLRVPPAGFWSRGGGQEIEEQTKLLLEQPGCPRGG